MENMNTNESLESVSMHSIGYTPGPWHVHGGYGCVVKAGEISIAECRQQLAHSEVVANAKLIAAAPTRLNALRRIVRHQDLIGGSMASMSSTRHIAAQAIQHATGETV